MLLLSSVHRIGTTISPLELYDSGSTYAWWLYHFHDNDSLLFSFRHFAGVDDGTHQEGCCYAYLCSSAAFVVDEMSSVCLSVLFPLKINGCLFHRTI